MTKKYMIETCEDCPDYEFFYTGRIECGKTRFQLPTQEKRKNGKTYNILKESIQALMEQCPLHEWTEPWSEELARERVEKIDYLLKEYEKDCYYGLVDTVIIDSLKKEQQKLKNKFHIIDEDSYEEVQAEIERLRYYVSYDRISNLPYKLRPEQWEIDAAWDRLITLWARSAFMQPSSDDNNE